MYNPHEHPDIAGEMDYMARGRLVKARLPDLPAPNVSWYWVALGNCASCSMYRPPLPGQDVACMSPKIPPDEFQRVRLYGCECPEFSAGAHPSSLKDDPRARAELDVMRAVGAAPGKPSQRVEVLRDLPWSIEASQQAHLEQEQFFYKAEVADAVARGEAVNDPLTAWAGNYTDLEDDLEAWTAASGAPPKAP